MKTEILSLQQEMAARGLDAYLIPTSDYHQSEYVNAFFKCREHFSGFNGSAGTLMVTREAAGLWTDSRYYLQAGQQLAGSGITLFRSGQKGVDSIPEYLRKTLPDGAVLGVDGRVISAAFGRELNSLMEKKQGELRYEEDLAASVWTDRPALTVQPVFRLDEKYAGQSAADKLAAIREDMKEKQADLHLVVSLEDIAWILNLRGGDVEYTPVFYSYLILTQEQALLFAFPDAFAPEIREYLREISVELRPYEEFYSCASEMAKGKKVLLDENKANYSLISNLAGAAGRIHALDPSSIRKIVKNETEIAGCFEAHRLDGLAMVNFIYWLKQSVGKIPLTEIDASDYLEQCRREQGILDLSFETIAGYGPHGAIVHYSATPETNAALAPEGFILVDSGGHYWQGTTDITRTIALGPLTEEMKLHYTLVLRCNLDLAMAKFQKGCGGANLDVLAHMPLWQQGLDYAHGTGHGVGYLLSVHEDPNSFSWSMKRHPNYVQAPGMITTDEPGIYLTDQYGIRIENELLCVQGEENEYGEFLQFEQLTFCPFEREAILPELLTEAEKKYLNEYHEMVYHKLKDNLKPEVAAWLREATLPL